MRRKHAKESWRKQVLPMFAGRAAHCAAEDLTGCRRALKSRKNRYGPNQCCAAGNHAESLA
jgi:hypothetical protein